MKLAVSCDLTRALHFTSTATHRTVPPVRHVPSGFGETQTVGGQPVWLDLKLHCTTGNFIPARYATVVPRLKQHTTSLTSACYLSAIKRNERPGRGAGWQHKEVAILVSDCHDIVMVRYIILLKRSAIKHNQNTRKKERHYILFGNDACNAYMTNK